MIKIFSFGWSAEQTTYRLHPLCLCTLLRQLLLTYLCPSLPVEHRPSTTPRYRTLFWAALVIPDQLVPCCFSSASVSRLQLLRGRPLFHFPCGFQVRAWRVVLGAGFLRVCPIQPHFLRKYLLGHWFLSRSLPQIFISDLLLPLDFVDKTAIQYTYSFMC